MLRVSAEAGADWVGLNLVRASPRYIGHGRDSVANRFVDLLLAAAEVNIRTVALVADPDEPTLRLLSGSVAPDVIQLHGQETPDFVAGLRSVLPNTVEVWKAIGVETAEDLDAANRYTAADRLLIDAKPPKNAEITGGHGRSFNWAILKNWEPAKPWLLAGGLTPDTVAGAIAETGTDAVDVSSGVERERGIKDEVLIRDFVSAAKGATANIH